MTATRSYIQHFGFTPEEGSSLSDATLITARKQIPRDIPGIVRLKPVQGPVSLPGRGAYAFSTADDIFVRTRLFSPTIATQWGFIQPIGTEEVENEQGVVVTSYAFRVFDGTDSWYWDGGAWAIAGAGDWNTLTDFNANLPALFASATSIAIEVRLRTTDGRFTPSLVEVLLKWTGQQISFFEEWIYNVLIASLQDSLRPESNFLIDGSGSISIPLGDIEFDTDLNIEDLICVFDETIDPDHTTNLLVSYDTGTQVITLSSAIPSGNRVFLTAIVVPQVSVTTSSDYSQEARVPAVRITNITPGARKGLFARGPGAIDQTLPVPAGTVYPLPIPLRDYDFSFATEAPTSLDLVKLNEAMSNWMDSHPVLRSLALDLGIRMLRGPVLNWTTTTTDPNDLRGGIGSFSLLNVPDFGNAGVANQAGDATAVVGPVDAGDPNNPGVGYGVKRLNMGFRQGDGAGSDSQTVTK